MAVAQSPRHRQLETAPNNVIERVYPNRLFTLYYSRWPTTTRAFQLRKERERTRRPGHGRLSSSPVNRLCNRLATALYILYSFALQMVSRTWRGRCGRARPKRDARQRALHNHREKETYCRSQRARTYHGWRAVQGNQGRRQYMDAW